MTKEKTKKVVINGCYGGFSLSHAAMMRYAELKGIKLYGYVPKRDRHGNHDLDNYIPFEGNEEERFLCIHYTTKKLEEGTSKELNDHYFEGGNRDADRDDPDLVKVVEELGEKANGSCASLKIVEIPEDVKFVIEEYDGIEWVSEEHRTWQ